MSSIIQLEMNPQLKSKKSDKLTYIEKQLIEIFQTEIKKNQKVTKLLCYDIITSPLYNSFNVMIDTSLSSHLLHCRTIFTISLTQQIFKTVTYFTMSEKFLSIKTQRAFLTFLPILLGLNLNLVDGVFYFHRKSNLLAYKQNTTAFSFQKYKLPDIVKLINTRISSIMFDISRHLLYFFLICGQVSDGKFFSQIHKTEDQDYFEMARNINISSDSSFLMESETTSIKNVETLESHLADSKKKLNQIKPINLIELGLYTSDLFFGRNNKNFQEMHNYEKIALQEIKKHLIVPKAKVKEEAQNKFLFNYINFESKEKQVILMKNNQMTLSLMSMIFRYVSSKSETENLKQSKFVLKKVMAYKSFALKKPPKHFQREKKIVELLQDAASNYIYKYYQCVNKREYKDLLFMDFSPSYQNGFNFLKKYGNHLTLIRKIRLMLHLAGGLRFLKSKGIVHMDLTLANILISPGDYKPRIIDFGESYSEVIKDIDYSPGFTNPFGPPEVLLKRKTFKNKQDSFSYGIILFFMFFGFFPFQPTNLLKLAYRNKTYLKKWFFVPESLSYLGQQKHMFLILKLISKCLDTNEDNRPEPEWSYVVMKQIAISLFRKCR